MTTLFDGHTPPPLPANGRLRLDLDFVLKVVGAIVAAMMLYGAIMARVAALETRQGEADKRFDRMESKIDRLLERVK